MTDAPLPRSRPIPTHHPSPCCCRRISPASPASIVMPQRSSRRMSSSSMSAPRSTSTRPRPRRSRRASATVVTYAAFNAGAATSQAGETPIALLPRAAAVDIVFDSADVFVTAIEAPKLSDAKLRQALPNLLEDRLLSESSDLHYAFQ